MKQIACAIFGILLLSAACKPEKTTTETSLKTRILAPGWAITDIDYSGFAPNPLDTTQIIPFSGKGENVSGYFKFQEDPALGEFEINFTSVMNFGLSQPLTFPVKEKHDGQYEINADNSNVKMWSNDTIFNWKVEINQEKRQTWSTSFLYTLPGLNIIVPLSVKATMKRD